MDNYILLFYFIFLFILLRAKEVLMAFFMRMIRLLVKMMKFIWISVVMMVVTIKRE